MKKNNIFSAVAFAMLLVTGCKKDFLEEKRDLAGVNEEVFQEPLLAKAYVDYIYGLFQPPNNSQALIWELAANGNSFTQTTEELPGESNWNKLWANVSFNNSHALPYFGEKLSTSIRNNTWTRLRQINIFLDEVDKHGLSADVKKELKGQLLYWRAWQYFDLLRLYGGVPLILTAQNPIAAEGNELEVQRSSSTETLNQIVKDLDAAIEMLPGKWPSAEWGRITSGGAAALKGRVLLTWASPLFNRTDDRARWQRAYDANLAAKTILEANGFGLYKSGSLANGEAWGKMFTAQEVNNPEAVIVYGFNNVTSDQVQKWNGWENAVRPRDILGGGSISPTKQMVDAFPMKDGKMPGNSTYTYTQNKFYKNRDPRFYKTFAYNGALYPYKENPNYRMWTYRWYNNTSETNPSRTTETFGANSSGIYLSKAASPTASNSQGNFSISGTDYMELRFAEVILNLAESAIGADKLTEGLEGIKAIRERAGVENLDGAYGLANVAGRDAMFAAVLNERKIEFAYEGKRFWDLRRWMLFNNDYGTVARLGVEPIEGMRRTGFFITVKNNSGSKYVGSATADPLKKKADGTVPVIDREPATYPAGITNFDQYLDYLYDNYFVVTEKNDLDPTSNDWKFRWNNAYYFFGINQSVLSASPYLEQTKGWDGIKGDGTFDPLK